jgi:hypothetical protein
MAAKRKTQNKSHPAKRSTSSVPRDLKAEVEAKASNLIANVLKPEYVQEPPEGRRSNYIIDIGTKWHREHFYFVSTYACPWPQALSPTFKSKFARMEYVGNERFALDFPRQADKWVRIYDSLTVPQCLKAIRGRFEVQAVAHLHNGTVAGYTPPGNVGDQAVNVSRAASIQTIIQETHTWRKVRSRD